LLIAANLLVLLAAAWVGWRLTSRYEGFVADFRHQQTAELARVASDDLLWNRYAAVAEELAQTASGSKVLAKAIAAGDGTVVEDLLGEEFKQGLVTQGSLALLGLTALTVDGQPVAARWAEPAAAAEL